MISITPARTASSRSPTSNSSSAAPSSATVGSASAATANSGASTPARDMLQPLRDRVGERARGSGARASPRRCRRARRARRQAPGHTGGCRPRPRGLAPARGAGSCVRGASGEQPADGRQINARQRDHLNPRSERRPAPPATALRHCRPAATSSRQIRSSRTRRNANASTRADARSSHCSSSIATTTVASTASAPQHAEDRARQAPRDRPAPRTASLRNSAAPSARRCGSGKRPNSSSPSPSNRSPRPENANAASGSLGAASRTRYPRGRAGIHRMAPNRRLANPRRALDRDPDRAGRRTIEQLLDPRALRFSPKHSIHPLRHPTAATHRRNLAEHAQPRNLRSGGHKRAGSPIYQPRARTYGEPMNHDTQSDRLNAIRSEGAVTWLLDPSPAARPASF